MPKSSESWASNQSFQCWTALCKQLTTSLSMVASCTIEYHLSSLQLALLHQFSFSALLACICIVGIEMFRGDRDCCCMVFVSVWTWAFHSSPMHHSAFITSAVFLVLSAPSSKRTTLVQHPSVDLLMRKLMKLVKIGMHIGAGCKR
jgi:hypothetical protein